MQFHYDSFLLSKMRVIKRGRLRVFQPLNRHVSVQNELAPHGVIFYFGALISISEIIKRWEGDFNSWVGKHSSVSSESFFSLDLSFGCSYRRNELL